MKKIIFITFLMFFCLEGWATDFPSLFEQALQKKLDISKEQIERGQRFSWVFVTGFLNEGAGWVGRYFGDNRDRLKTYIPGEEVYILRPSSSNSIETNAVVLLKELRDIYERHHKKIVVITHSKGSPEILKMLANEPQATAQIIQVVLTIQAAFGSHVADLFTGNILKEKEGFLNLSISQKIPIQISFFAKRFLNLFLAKGLKSLTVEESEKIFSPAVIEVLSSHPVPIYFLRTKQKVKALAKEEENTITWGIEPTAQYLNFYGENDGLITVDRQKLNGTGTDLGIINADHTDTVLETPVSNTPSSFRYALTDAIFFYLMR